MDRLRRLDALFAEKVLGKHVSTMKFKALLTDEYTDELVTLDDPCLSVIVPKFTRSLDAAWEGVTATNRDEITFTLSSNWSCRAAIDDEGVHAQGAHPAEALVLACLRAVGVDESELA